MAKAADVPLTPGMTFADAARTTVRVRAAELVEHRAGVLDTGDIERVHAMRVAARRLRAALETFAPCFGAELHRPLLRDVGALADALGARRDPDVQLLALQDFGAAAPEIAWEGVELFAARLREEQVAANAGLALALREADAGDLAGRLARLTGDAHDEAAPRGDASDAALLAHDEDPADAPSLAHDEASPEEDAAW